MTELQKIEKRIELAINAGKNAMIATIKLLGDVYEKKLWEESYKSFSEYCEKRWHFSRIRGYQIVGSAEILKLLPEKVLSALNSEKAIAALKDVPPDEREKVIEKASKSGKVTAKSIKKAAKDETPPLLDKTGLLIPTAIERDWDRSKDLAEFMLSRISQVKVALEKGMEDESEIFTEVTNSTLSKLKYIYQDLKRLEPHAVCTSCQGSTSKEKCSLCGHRGFISEFIYRNCSPEETRKIREAK